MKFHSVKSALILFFSLSLLSSSADEKFLENTILPAAEMENTTLEEIAEFLRLRSIELDPKKQGMSFNILTGPTKVDPAKPYENPVQAPAFIKKFSAKNITYKSFLDQITKGSDFTYSLEPIGVIFKHKDFKKKPTPSADKLSPEDLAKLQKITIPEAHFSNTTLEEAAMFLTLRSQELSEDNGGFVITKAAHWKDEQLTTIDHFNSRNAPLDDILNYLAQAFEFDYEISGQTIILSSTSKN